MAPGVHGKDHYAMLEVSMSADDAAIAASYRRLARLKHPDKNRENPDATAEFQALQEAYTVLKDDTKRYEYDRRLLLKKNPAGGSAPRARATAARTAATSASASATMAATAAVVEKLRQKRKQSQQEQSAAAGAGIFSFHVNASWDGKETATAEANGTIPNPPTPQPTAAQATGIPQPNKKSNDNNDNAEPVVVDRSNPDLMPGAGRMYPPPPPDMPRWPDKPPGKDHALENQIHQVRKEIRAEEKAIRRLERATRKNAKEIAALWDLVRRLNGELAMVTAMRAKMEEKLVEQEWHDGLFGDQPAMPASFPMPRTVSPKTAERMRQNERAHKSLQKKLAKAHEAIEAIMAGSRALSEKTEEAYARKAASDATLHELGRRWRINEFGIDTSVDGDNSGSGFAGEWDGWCGWDEGEVDLDADDKNDSAEDDNYDNTSTEYQGSYIWGAHGNGSASWWHNSNGGDSDTLCSNYGGSFAFDPNVNEWVPGDDGGAPVAEADSSLYYGAQGVHGNAQDLDEIFFDTQVDDTQAASAGQSPFSGYFASSDKWYQQQEAFPQYGHHSQHGYYDTMPCSQTVSGNAAYHEPSNGEDSSGGGAALSGGSPGKGKQAREQQQQQMGQQANAELVDLIDINEGDENKTCTAEPKEQDKAKEELVSVTTGVTTGQRTDSLQTTTTTITSSPDNGKRNGNVKDAKGDSCADGDGSDDGDDGDGDGDDSGHGDGKEVEQARGWPDELDASLIDLGSPMSAESSDLLEMARASMGTVIPPNTAMSLPPAPPTSQPYRRGVTSHISTLAGTATATQAWWPGEEYAAEQVSGDMREMAWRHAQWHEW
ncbi:MAG: hypothetical protein STHCBS139747_007070 [Sporothrix thermara]